MKNHFLPSLSLAEQTVLVNLHTSVAAVKRNKKLLLAFAFGVVVVILLQHSHNLVTACNSKYDLLNPVFRCDDFVKDGEWNYEALRSALVQKRAELKGSKKLSHISMFFRDLDHGPRFAVGDYDKFSPGSLLKVPVMLAILHEADKRPEVLNETLSFSGSLDSEKNIEDPNETIQSNTPYTILELLKKMIIYSDNYSRTLLVNRLNATPPPLVYDAFLDLDVLAMMRAPQADYVPIQSYANLFAILYNTGYLSNDMSQFALGLLSQSDFKDGLVAGVPPGTRVAHKFGFRTFPDADSQLHDCGIVYHPATSYILCVMTSGPNVADEEAAIAEVSRMTYDKLSAMRF